MVYSLEFSAPAIDDWRKLSFDLQQKFTQRLAERLQRPRVLNARLHGMPDCYKIKLRADGYRLVYRVFDNQLMVQVVAVSHRDEVYISATQRLHYPPNHPTTGAWSEGLSTRRGDSSMLQSVRRSAAIAESSRWSMRNP